MRSWHLHISGQVQGVGFRPFVFRLSVAEGLKGWVKNTNDGVHLFFNAESTAWAKSFCQRLIEQAPAIAHVTDYQLVTVPFQAFTDFRIVHSEEHGPTKLLLSPDFGLCADCREDLFAKDNRRRDYAFTTCTYCGPRFSITRALPYDRPLTTMDEFSFCANCHEEYHTPTDRRYFSQTNSCPACGIKLELYTQAGEQLSGTQSSLLDRVVEFWRAGKIVALKGIGGYLLTCDAANVAAIRELRERKHRPSKPLAVLFPNVDTLANYTSLSSTALRMLSGPVAPITLLPLQGATQTELATKELTPGLDKLGVMLPYTPLYEVLMARFGAPVVATSGNRSGQPIIYADTKALADLQPLADYILINDREILLPQDDSVLQWSTHYQQRIILRRARGLAPTLCSPHPWETNDVLAMGADMKSTFALLHQKQVYLSPYLGNLTDLATQENHREIVDHLRSVLQARPSCILTDAHPQYASTQLGKETATRADLPIVAIPHHEAHFAAILGEHNLTTTESPVLGVVWDGTGLGTDGQIWGGELFDYRQGRIAHLGQLDYFSSSLGDKLAREPRLCAWSLLACADISPEILIPAFSTQEYAFYQQFFARPVRLQTSSVGRLFDGVAALLGLKWAQSHEAEAAMLLETFAQAYIQAHSLDAVHSYFSFSDFNGLNFPTAQLVTKIVADVAAGRDRGAIAASFHRSLVSWVAAVAQTQNYGQIAFSGGVFQNSLMVDMGIHYLGQAYTLYFHQELSPNDENIAYGQLVWYDIKQRLVNTKSEEYVLSHTR